MSLSMWTCRKSVSVCELLKSPYFMRFGGFAGPKYMLEPTQIPYFTTRTKILFYLISWCWNQPHVLDLLQSTVERDMSQSANCDGTEVTSALSPWRGCPRVVKICSELSEMARTLINKMSNFYGPHDVDDDSDDDSDGDDVDDNDDENPPNCSKFCEMARNVITFLFGQCRCGIYGSCMPKHVRKDPLACANIEIYFPRQD
jgi:hypothetical protein